MAFKALRQHVMAPPGSVRVILRCATRIRQPFLRVDKADRWPRRRLAEHRDVSAPITASDAIAAVKYRPASGCQADPRRPDRALVFGFDPERLGESAAWTKTCADNHHNSMQPIMWFSVALPACSKM